MVEHYIIMSSSYSDGARIALDITDEKMLSHKPLGEIVDEIKHICGYSVPLATHYLQTEDKSWDSVIQSNAFFKDVICVKDVKEFASKIKKDKTLIGIDVANYITSRIKCTHLALEKLVYFAYAEHLCKFHEKLFTDKIYAFTYGPVVDSVYERYKQSGFEYIQPADDKDPVQSSSEKMPTKSRILFAENGSNKLSSIDFVIEKYGGLPAGKLVDLTHKAGSPWARVDSSKSYQKIPDELIKQYHYVERI